jgi:hypothetical protein
MFSGVDICGLSKEEMPRPDDEAALGEICMAVRWLDAGRTGVWAIEPIRAEPCETGC